MVFDLAHLPYWIFLGLGVVLFLLVIFSGGGDSDGDVDIDADADWDTDLDMDVEADAEGGFSALQALGWLGLGKAPLLLLLAIDFSLWGLLGWVLNLLLGIPTGLFGNVVLIVSLILSLFGGSLISRPIGKLFTAFGEDTRSDRLIGCLGTVASPTLPQQPTTQIGQVDAIDSANNLVSINVQLPQWATQIPQRGDKVIIIEYSEPFYLAVVKDSVDQKRWLG
ncbi:DUF1449 family protein [Roseofilum reptotaenium CS-1145]|uniref:DUF1449 domain-containing protein n=1 Tax=Roseofilum reptotaenium AO1-A TaxID=1925591 RepID=A0A1L9QPF9_9CYAN|nr:OB-fold-containig protein [Roseofilum reptotaenium]MDB9519559.1 DUF1449 family protein [Roseofilum reptotaenium CS-1145]OJJ24560.1 DUF1449 domain-containing protein [Roseofilum reptotaenium AO1-A]